MAINDGYLFLDGLFLRAFSEAHNFNSGDTIKAAIIKSAANGGHDPAVDDAHPCWGAGGTTDLSASEVTPGGDYDAGGAECANVVVVVADPYTYVDADNPTAWAIDPSNPSNARWIVFYNDTAPNKECIGWYDIGSDYDMTTGELSVTLGSPFFRVTNA